MHVIKRNLMLNGWRVGFDKVQLTKTLQSELGYTLAPAKSVTDRVLAGEVVSLALEDRCLKEEELLRTLQGLGVHASVEDYGFEALEDASSDSEGETHG